MYFPYFQLGCYLEINAQRTAAYLASTSSVCNDGDIQSRMDLRCECDPLNWALDENESWAPVAYNDPVSDQVTWFDASIPESAQFLGFMIEEVVQRESVTSRNLTTRLSTSGGGVIGPYKNKERRYDFTVLLFACNEIAMEYGFRFLNDALMSPGCDTGSALCDAEFRDSCPQVDGFDASLEQGRWLLKNVGAVEGPVWADDPLDGSRCNIRRVRFSIASELPWKFKCPVFECQKTLAGYPSVEPDCANYDEIMCGQQEVSCLISEELIVGETGMIIEVKAGTIPLQNIEIEIRPDPYGYEAFPGTRPPGYQRTEPCDRIVVPSIPASSTLVYDTSIEDISVRMPGGGITEGTIYIATDDGEPPSFPTLRCGAFCVSVSVSECSVVGSPYVRIQSVHREL